MSTATLSSKGQATIPKDIRDRLHLKQGDRLEFIMETDGSVRMIPHNLDVAALHGILPKPAKSLSVDEMGRVIREGWARRVQGSVKSSRRR